MDLKAPKTCNRCGKAIFLVKKVGIRVKRRREMTVAPHDADGTIHRCQPQVKVYSAEERLKLQQQYEAKEKEHDARKKRRGGEEGSEEGKARGQDEGEKRQESG